MDSLIKTPVSIITGFLGSGKTTLISNLINKFRNGKLAIIVNEFGDLGVDGEILKSQACLMMSKLSTKKSGMKKIRFLHFSSL